MQAQLAVAVRRIALKARRRARRVEESAGPPVDGAAQPLDKSHGAPTPPEPAPGISVLMRLRT